MKVKVCGMREPENIKAVSGTKPDYLGFIFYGGSKRAADPDQIRAIQHTIPEGIKRVGVFVNEDINRIIDISTDLHLAYAQLHGNESPEYCKMLHAEGILSIKALQISEDFNFETLEEYRDVEYFLFDTPSAQFGGTGRSFAWEVLRDYNGSKPYFLSGGIGPDAVPRINALELEHMPFAIDINSRFEISPGLKDVENVSQFIRSIRRDVYSI
jgi:phosphoribosylanthranilate isomerase